MVSKALGNHRLLKYTFIIFVCLYVLLMLSKSLPFDTLPYRDTWSLKPQAVHGFTDFLTVPYEKQIFRAMHIYQLITNVERFGFLKYAHLFSFSLIFGGIYLRFRRIKETFLFKQNKGILILSIMIAFSIPAFFWKMSFTLREGFSLGMAIIFTYFIFYESKLLRQFLLFSLFGVFAILGHFLIAIVFLPIIGFRLLLENHKNFGISFKKNLGLLLGSSFFVLVASFSVLNNYIQGTLNVFRPNSSVVEFSREAELLGESVERPNLGSLYWVNDKQVGVGMMIVRFLGLLLIVIDLYKSRKMIHNIWYIYVVLILFFYFITFFKSKQVRILIYMVPLYAYGVYLILLYFKNRLLHIGSLLLILSVLGMHNRGVYYNISRLDYNQLYESYRMIYEESQEKDIYCLQSACILMDFRFPYNTIDPVKWFNVYSVINKGSDIIMTKNDRSNYERAVGKQNVGIPLKNAGYLR